VALNIHTSPAGHSLSHSRPVNGPLSRNGQKAKRQVKWGVKIRACQRIICRRTLNEHPENGAWGKFNKCKTHYKCIYGFCSLLACKIAEFMIPLVIQNSKFIKLWLNIVGNIIKWRYFRIIKYVLVWLTLWFTQLKY